MSNWLTNPLSYVLALGVISAVASIGIWAGRVTEAKGSVAKAIQEIRAGIKKIFERLPPLTSTVSSPMRLTDLGREISQEIAAREWAKELVPLLAEQLKDKSPYDIQEACRNYCFDISNFQSSEGRVAACRDSAYQHGLEIKQVMNVLGLELRDAMLAHIGLGMPE